MQLEKMTAKNLQNWVLKLYKIINEETNPHNLALYTKWLNEAKYEQEQRYDRRMKYLKGGSYGKKD